MQRRFRWMIIAVLGVCAAWTGVWFYAASFTGKAVDKWMARQASQGRNWTCKDREVAGYPFRMLIRCKSLSYEGPARDGRVKVSLGPVRAIAQVYNPKLILAEAEGPLKVQLPGATRKIDANWSVFRVSLRTAKPIPERLSIKIEKLVMQVETANGKTEKIAAANAEFHIRPAPDVKADIGSTDLALLITKAASESANHITGEDAPIDASIVTRITRVPLLLTGPRDQRLEQWRLAKGTLTLQNSTITKGRAQLVASGRLALDDAHRPAGQINAKAAGVSVLLRKLGLPEFLVSAGSLLGGLLSGGKQTGTEPSRAFIPLPIVIRDGRVRIGPKQLKGELKPLY